MALMVRVIMVARFYDFISNTWEIEWMIGFLYGVDGLIDYSSFAWFISGKCLGYLCSHDGISTEQKSSSNKRGILGTPDL